MSVWVLIPSIRPAAQAHPVITQWAAMGYKVALYRPTTDIECNYLLREDTSVEHIGWGNSINILARHVLVFDFGCNWFVAGADDVEPDPQFAPEIIAASCVKHFCGSFGVMQPTGDRWGNGAVDTAATSPWIGREFALNMYGGLGPMFAGYHYYFADTELQAVSQAKGCFWQCPDLIQTHLGWRGKATRTKTTNKTIKEYNKAAQLYEEREERGFPGSEIRL